MAIPKSTYVMGVAVLGLFGLAIHETASGGHDRDHHDDDGVAAAAASAEPAELAEEAQEKAAQHARELEREEAFKEIRGLYGAEIATPGAVFEGIPLGAKDLTELSPEAKDRIEHFELMAKSSVIINGDGFWINVMSGGSPENQEPVCSELANLLHTAWGRGDWVNPATHVRASFSDYSGCTLRFEHYIEADKWLGRTATSAVPLGLMGKSLDKVQAQVGGEIETDGMLHWKVPGIGTASGPTEVAALFSLDKLVSLDAGTDLDAQTSAQLAEALQKNLGKPRSVDKDGGVTVMTWAGSPPIAVTLTDLSVTVHVGKP